MKIVIVDDHEIFRRGLEELLHEVDDSFNIKIADSGESFLEMLKEEVPDLVFMDIEMPSISGIETTEKATKAQPELKVIAMSMHDEEEYLDAILFAGAKGFLLKSVGIDEIGKAVKAIMNGQGFFSEELQGMLAQKFMDVNQNKFIERGLECLSDRELEVLQCVCDGNNNRDVAEILSLSPRTIEKYRAQLMDKTGAKNTIQLLTYAIKNNLVKL